MSGKDIVEAGESCRRMALERMADIERQPAASLDTADMASLIHELMVHQEELEIQNEELIEARSDLEVNSQLLAELYDFAPVGYFSVSVNGQIHQLNLLGARMLGMDRAPLLGMGFAQFVAPENRRTFDRFLSRVFTGENSEPCEVTLSRKDQSVVIVRLTGALSPNGLVCRMAAMDVTDQQRMESEVRERNEDLDRIFYLSHDLLGIAGNDGCFRRVNPAFERTFGHGPDVLTGCDFIDFVHPDDRDATGRVLARIRAGEEIMDFVNRCRCADGSYRSLEWRITPYEDQMMCAVARDITERVQTREALQASEERLRLAMEAAQIGSWDWDLQTNEVFWSPHHELMLGYEPGTPSRNYEDFKKRLHPDDAEMVETTLREAVEHGTDYSCDFRVVWPDGSIHWISGLGRLIQAAAERPARMLGMVMDITGRMEAEEALRLSEQKFRSIVECSPTALHLYRLGDDDRLLLVNANPAADRELGIEHASLIGKTLEEAFPNLEGTEIPGMYRGIARGEVEPSKFEFPYESAGISKYFDVHVFQAHPGKIAVAFTDISERRNARKALEKSQEELESRVRHRTGQLQYRTVQLRALAEELSHAEERERRRIAGLLHEDLQQMLVAAMLNLEMLKSRIAGQEEIDEFARIEEMLRNSIKTARSLTAELSPPALQQCGLAAGLRWLGSWCHEKYGMDVHMEVEAEANPGSEMGVTLFQCVRELLLNIIKHAGVKTCAVRMWPTDGGIVNIEVSDEGAGFDPEEVRSREGAVGGFGLFSIRERLEWLGGGLEIESSAGSGSRFTLWVPLEITRPKGGNAKDSHPSKPLQARPEESRRRTPE